MWVALLFFAAVPARAGVLGTWGGGEIGAAGNAGVATSSAHSAWYNPATLDAKNFDATGEFVWGGGAFAVTQGRGETEEPFTADSRGALVGVALNNYWLGLPDSNIGLSLFLPAQGPFRWFDPEDALKEEAPNANVPRWSSGLSRLDAAVGWNYWLHDRVSIGLGADISAAFTTLTFVEIDDLDDVDTARKGQDVTIRPTVHPTAGVCLVVGDLEGVHARFGVLGRTGRWMDDAGTTYITMLGGDFIFRHHYYRYYAPPMVTLGADLRPSDLLSFRAEGSYEAWSRARGPYYEDLSKDWSNTVTARLGARIAAGGLRFLAGYAYDPGPAVSVPRRSLHVDGPSHALTSGVGVVLRTVEARHLTAQVGMRTQRFIHRTIPARGARNVDFEGHLLGLRAGIGWGR